MFKEHYALLSMDMGEGINALGAPTIPSTLVEHSGY